MQTTLFINNNSINKKGLNVIITKVCIKEQ